MGRNRDYDAYVKYYKQEKAKMKKEGYSMNLKKLTKTQWEVRFNAMYKDRQDEIAQGNRKIIGNINRDIAVSQKWERTRAQANAFLQHWDKANGKKPKVKDVQAGKYANTVTTRYNELIRSGLSGQDVSKIITDEFYGGSP